MSQAIDRREALGRVALLLGGALSAPALMGALRETTGRAWAAAPPGAPRTLNPAQLECVATAADHIVPETDTPGARAAGVHHFIDTLLTDHYPATERDRFVAGLTRLDERARSAKGSAFAECAPDQRVAWLTELDTRAYGPDAGDDGWFFRRLKELTLVGYYTSEIGASQELHVSPFGTFRGDIPYASVGRAWS